MDVSHSMSIPHPVIHSWFEDLQGTDHIRKVFLWVHYFLSEISDGILISISSHCIWFYFYCFEEELLLETCSHEDIVRPDLLTISLVYQMDSESMMESNGDISSYWGPLSSWAAAMGCACAPSLLQAEKMHTSVSHHKLFFSGQLEQPKRLEQKL